MERPFQHFLSHYSVSAESVDLQTLRQIARAFSFLPYENITKILKESHSTDPQYKLRQAGEVVEDHLRWRTGGTCFSLCNALQNVLEQSGFRSFIAMGDMHYGANIHCAVIVELEEGRFLLDPGYLLHAPIPLPLEDGESRQKTSMNTIFLRSENAHVFSLYTLEMGQMKWRYRLRAVRISQGEFTQHWLRSFSLNSMENVMISRLEDGSRIYFRKDRLDFVGQGKRQKWIIKGSEIGELSAIFDLPADLIRKAQTALLSRRALKHP
jgi:Arylamine N-acetyltransferase